jgi:hypothetical protein
MFALGALLAELHTLRPLFPGENEVLFVGECSLPSSSMF